MTPSRISLGSALEASSTAWPAAVEGSEKMPAWMTNARRHDRVTIKKRLMGGCSA